MKTAGTEIERLVMPRYSYADADHLAVATRGTSKRWILGYQYLTPKGERVAQPPVTLGVEREGAISFVDLVEIVAIGELKHYGFSLKTIRHIVRNCQEMFDEERPLATLRFKTDGREIFVDVSTHLVEVGRRKREQAWLEVLEPFLESLDYTAGLASRWWPMGRGGSILVDPEYAFGYPVIRGSGVRTDIILERSLAGEQKGEIAEDFDLHPSDVEVALKFELRRIAA